MNHSQPTFTLAPADPKTAASETSVPRARAGARAHGSAPDPAVTASGESGSGGVGDARSCKPSGTRSTSGRMAFQSTDAGCASSSVQSRAISSKITSTDCAVSPPPPRTHRRDFDTVAGRRWRARQPPPRARQRMHSEHRDRTEWSPPGRQFSASAGEVATHWRIAASAESSIRPAASTIGSLSVKPELLSLGCFTYTSPGNTSPARRAAARAPLPA